MELVFSSRVKHPPMNHYRNTIAGSSLGKWIFICFEKIRFASQQTEFLIYLSKKSVKMTLNGLDITKYCHNQFILLCFFCLHNFLFCTFKKKLELFLDEPAMVLCYLYYMLWNEPLCFHLCNGWVHVDSMKFFSPIRMVLWSHQDMHLGGTLLHYPHFRVWGWQAYIIRLVMPFMHYDYTKCSI